MSDYLRWLISNRVGTRRWNNLTMLEIIGMNLQWIRKPRNHILQLYLQLDMLSVSTVCSINSFPVVSCIITRAIRTSVYLKLLFDTPHGESSLPLNDTSNDGGFADERHQSLAICVENRGNNHTGNSTHYQHSSAVSALGCCPSAVSHSHGFPSVGRTHGIMPRLARTLQLMLNPLWLTVVAVRYHLLTLENATTAV